MLEIQALGDGDGFLSICNSAGGVCLDFEQEVFDLAAAIDDYLFALCCFELGFFFYVCVNLCILSVA